MFHEWRVLPLMQRARRLDEMVPDAPLEGTVLMMEDLNRDEIKKRVKLVLGSIPSDATLDLHSPMRPDDDFIEMVSALHPLRFFVLSFLSPDLVLKGPQGSLCVIHNFNPPLPEDVA
jgi:hypothetical protein